MDWTPERIRALRARFNLNQSQLASALGLRRTSTVSEFETGRVTPKGQTLLLLAAVEAHGPTVGHGAPASAADRLDLLATEAASIAADLRGAS